MTRSSVWWSSDCQVVPSLTVKSVTCPGGQIQVAVERGICKSRICLLREMWWLETFPSDNEERSCWKLWWSPLQFSLEPILKMDGHLLIHGPLPASSSFFLSLSLTTFSFLFLPNLRERDKKEAKSIATRIKINNKEAQRRRNVEERVGRRAVQGEVEEVSHHS